LGQLCNTFVEREGPSVGIAADPYGGADLLLASGDDFIAANFDRYALMLQDVSLQIAPTVSPNSGGRPIVYINPGFSCTKKEVAGAWPARGLL